MSTATRIGFVWNEILVTVDVFGDAMCEKCAQSQGFGIFGPGRAGRIPRKGWNPMGGGGGSANREPG